MRMKCVSLLHYFELLEVSGMHYVITVLVLVSACRLCYNFCVFICFISHLYNYRPFALERKSNTAATQTAFNRQNLAFTLSINHAVINVTSYNSVSVWQQFFVFSFYFSLFPPRIMRSIIFLLFVSRLFFFLISIYACCLVGFGSYKLVDRMEKKESAHINTHIHTHKVCI